ARPGAGIPGTDGALEEPAHVVDLDARDLDPFVATGGSGRELQLSRLDAQQLAHQGDHGVVRPASLGRRRHPHLEGAVERAHHRRAACAGLDVEAQDHVALSGYVESVGEHGPYSREMASPESAGADLPYPDVEPQPNLPKLEEAILSFWADDGTFQASIDQRPAGPDGSLLTGYVKDVVPRFRTMQGRRVERRFGWDCHGLPPEMQAEKELGLDTKADIVEYGVDKFNAYCQSSVLRYTQEWEQYVTRQARWVDFRNDYKTMDLDYMESVLWALKELWAKDLLYEGFNVLAYCGVCETPLSNFETRQDDAYRERQDPAVTVAFTLEGGEKILVWTTTPWTLPSNLALAVGPDIDYAVFEEDGTRYIIGEATVDKYEAQLAGATRVGTVKGRELVG